MKIWQAAQIIEAMYKKEIGFIEYEDGSNHKFNFRFKFENKQQFINLKNIIHKDNLIQGIVNKM